MRLSRLLCMERGSALLVGVGGSGAPPLAGGGCAVLIWLLTAGRRPRPPPARPCRPPPPAGKQSMARLAAYIAGAYTFQITITKTYNVANLLEDIRVGGWAGAWAGCSGGLSWEPCACRAQREGGHAAACGRLLPSPLRTPTRLPSAPARPRPPRTSPPAGPVQGGGAQGPARVLHLHGRRGQGRGVPGVHQPGADDGCGGGRWMGPWAWCGWRRPARPAPGRRRQARGSRRRRRRRPPLPSPALPGFARGAPAGEIAGLFAKDELDAIVNDIRPAMRAECPGARSRTRLGRVAGAAGGGLAALLAAAWCPSVPSHSLAHQHTCPTRPRQPPQACPTPGTTCTPSSSTACATACTWCSASRPWARSSRAGRSR